MIPVRLAPFFLATALATRFQHFTRATAPWLPALRWCSAGLIVATGVGIMTGTFWRIGFWMLRFFPFLSIST